MPYSENNRSVFASYILSSASNLRSSLDIWLSSFYPDMKLPRVDLHGKTAIVTGANAGIGYECALSLAGMGAHVILACRDERRGQEAKQKIVANTGNEAVELEILDCGSFDNVKAFLDRWERRREKQVHILINNAGGISSTLVITPDDFEQTYQTNHLSHVLLTHSLLNRGCMTSDARIVSVSSVGSYNSDHLDKQNVGGSDILTRYTPGAPVGFEDAYQLYCRSKMMQVIWSITLQRRLSQVERWKGISVHCCNPGIVNSDIWHRPTGAGSLVGWKVGMFRTVVGAIGITKKQGAVVPVWLATDPKPAEHELRGMYWDRFTWQWVRPWCLESARQEELWAKWCENTQVFLLA